MKKVILFDLDGTLLDTLEDLAEAVNYALAKRDLPLHTTREYRTMVGHGVRDLVQKALPEDRKELTEACLADFKGYYSDHIDDRTRPYPGMQALLRTLSARGAALAVASNKFQEGTERLVRKFFPDIPFVAILGNREGFPLKPDAKIVGEVLRKAGAGPEEAVLVGDSLTDMKTAENGGIEAIAVTWGYRVLPPSDRYAQAGSAAELEALLLKERHPFAPFLPEQARILFLGSFPPPPKRWSMPFYYPNFLNDFWRILGIIHFGDREHFIIPGEKRFDQPRIEAFCREKGLAFYDTACEVIRRRDNASDQFLEVVRPTDLAALLERLPRCEAIVVTGEKAAGTLAGYCNAPVPPVGGSVDVQIGNRTVRCWRMPSTSRAYPLPLEKKAESYRALFERYFPEA